jgi:hypothetical protein
MTASTTILIHIRSVICATGSMLEYNTVDLYYFLHRNCHESYGRVDNERMGLGKRLSGEMCVGCT